MRRDQHRAAAHSHHSGILVTMGYTYLTPDHQKDTFHQSSLAKIK